MAGPFDPFGGTLFGGDPTAAPVAQSPWSWVPDEWSGAAMPAPIAGPPTADQGPMVAPDAIPPPAPVDAQPPPMPFGAGFIPTPIGPPTQPPPTPAPTDPNALMSPSGAIESGAQRYKNDPLSDPNVAEGGKLAEDMAVNDPLRFQEELIKHDQAAKARASSERVRIEEENLRGQERSLSDYKTSMAFVQQKQNAIAMDAQRLADTKINPDRYQQGGIARNIGIAANLIIGGLNAVNTGGKNTGAEWLSQQVDRDIDAQKADIVNGWKGVDLRNNLVAQEFARTGDLYHATETVRLGAYQAGINKLDAEMQNFDPNGTTVLRMGMAKQELVAKQAAAIEAQRKTIFDEKYKLLQEQSKIDTNAETRRHNQAEEGIAWAKESREGAKAKAENEVYSPEVLQAIYKSQGIDIPLPPKAMSLAEHSKLVEGVGKAREAQANEAATTVQGPNGKPLTQNGTTLRLPAPQAEKVNKSIAYTQDFISVLGDARRMLASDPSKLDRATWNDITTRYEKAKFAMIKGLDMNPSSREMQAVEEMFGPNFDSFKDRLINRRTAMRRIDTLLDTSQSELATHLKQEARYTGPSVLSDTSRPDEHVETVDEHDLKTLLGPPTDYGTFGGNTTGELKEIAAHGGMTDDQSLILDDIGRNAKSTDAGRRSKALDQLGRAVMKSETPGVAAKAAALLRAVGAVPTGPQIGGP